MSLSFWFNVVICQELMDATQAAILSNIIDPTWTSWSTIWSAISALGTVAALAAILYAVRQLKFDAWIKIQEKWNDLNQYNLRKELFERRDKGEKDWTPDQIEAAKNVCGRMDEFARLVKFTN